MLSCKEMPCQYEQKEAHSLQLREENNMQEIRTIFCPRAATSAGE